MDYQSKTTLLTMSVGLWDETTKRDLASRFNAAHAVAVQIASSCRMDIMSFVPYSIRESGEEECYATVVYVNNGLSLDDICRLMKPELSTNPPQYWMLQDLTKWQGALECVVSVRGNNQEWN